MQLQNLTIEQNVKVLQILDNTLNTNKFNTCFMCYFLCVDVFYLVLFFGDCVLLFMFHWCVRVCSPILTNVPNLFNFQRINFCPKPYIDESLSLIKHRIIYVILFLIWKIAIERCWHRISLNFFTLIFENLTQILFNFEVLHLPKSHF